MGHNFVRTTSGTAYGTRGHSLGADPAPKTEATPPTALVFYFHGQFIFWWPMDDFHDFTPNGFHDFHGFHVFTVFTVFTFGWDGWVGWVGCVFFFRQPNPTIGFAMRHKNGRRAYSLRPHMTFQFSFFWEP